MNDDEDIASTLNGLDAPGSTAAPKSEDDDIASTLGGLDKPATPAPDQHGKQTLRSERPYAQKVSSVESGGNANAHAPGSTATGLGQFTEGTWLPLVKKHRPDIAHGKSDSDLLAMRTDPDLNSQMIDAYAEDNTPKLTASGIPVNHGSLYGAHWFGPEGFSKIYNADPTTPIEDVIGKDAAANNHLSGKTTDDVMTLAARKMGMDNMPKDYTLGQTMDLAAHNLGPSVVRAGTGLVDAVTHPTQTYSTIKQLGAGLLSKAKGYAGVDQNPDQKEQDEQLVDALGHSYKEKYGTWQGFQNYLAHDPAGVAFDASTVATLGGGGVGFTGKVLSKVGATTAGAVTEAAGRGITAAGNAINPLNLATRAISRPTAVLDSSGNILPKVDDLIKKATNGTMSGADIVDPTMKKVFAATVSGKPLTEASVKEGILKSLGMKTPTPVVTGVAGPAGTAEHVADAIKDNNSILEKHATALGGPGSGSDIAAALDQAHTSSMNRANAAYDSIRNVQGSFGGRMPGMSDLGTQIKQNFARSGMPSSSIQALKDAGNMNSASALELLNKYWGRGKTLTPGNDFNAAEVLAMRKRLTELQSASSGADLKAMGDIRSAVDAHIANQSALGKFVNPQGKPIADLSQKIGAANKAYKTHFDTFETPNGTNNSIVNAVQKLKASQRRTSSGSLMPSGDTDLYTNVQSGLGKDLMNPTKGADTYNKLLQGTRGSASVPALVKSSLMDGIGGDNKVVKNATAILSDPNSVAAKALSPDELAQARHIHAANVINNAKPSVSSRAHSILSGAIGSAVGKGLTGLLGYETLGPAGIPIGIGMEAAGEHIGRGMAAKRVMQGAPKGSLFNRAIKGTVKTVTGPKALAAEHYSQDQSIARASGGKVDMEALVTRLMNRWKSAKKATDQTTKPLLGVPDETIAKALSIAQEHI
jgi:hypothetical protein